jgi:hypothetical protein
MFWPKDLLADPERFLAERLGFGVLAHILVQHGQAIEAAGRVEMFWSKNLLPDPERFLVERLGFGVLAHILVQHGQMPGLRKSRGQVLIAQTVILLGVDP